MTGEQMTDAMTTPPRPRLAIRVGVTGHRPVPGKEGRTKLPPEAIPAVTAAIGDVLDRITVAAETVRQQHAHAFAPADEESCIRVAGDRTTSVEGVVVSGLAPGEGGERHHA